MAGSDVVMLNVLAGAVFTVGCVGAAGRMTGTAAATAGLANITAARSAAAKMPNEGCAERSAASLNRYISVPQASRTGRESYRRLRTLRQTTTERIQKILDSGLASASTKTYLFLVDAVHRWMKWFCLRWYGGRQLLPIRCK